MSRGTRYHDATSSTTTDSVPERIVMSNFGFLIKTAKGRRSFHISMTSADTTFSHSRRLCVHFHMRLLSSRHPFALSFASVLGKMIFRGVI